MLQEGGRPGFEVSRQYFSYETYALALPRDDGAFRLLVDRTLGAALSHAARSTRSWPRPSARRRRDEMLKTMILIHALPDK